MVSPHLTSRRMRSRGWQRRLARLVYLCVLQAVTVIPSHAQEAEPDAYARGALGLGIDATKGAEGGNLGYVACLQLGFRMKAVWIGLEHTGWYDHEDTRSRSFNRSIFVMVTPIQNGPFIKAGAGLATSDPWHPIRYTVVDRYGLGLVGGIGYDIALNRTVSITVGADFLYHQYGIDEPLPSAKQIVAFSLGATYWVFKK